MNGDVPNRSPDNLIMRKALSNLLDAVSGVLAFDWSDNDRDAAEAIERLRQANGEYGVVERLSHG